MTVRSYAQNFEDVLLWRALQHVPDGRYVDVGAGHPSRNSVTKLFYDNGWSGVNVEPLPHLADELTRARPRDTTVQAAVSSSGEPTVDLVTIDLWDELSTVSEQRATALLEEGRGATVVPVPVVRLDDLLVGDDRPVHFLKVDVEGAELDVLSTLDLDRTRPWIVLAEVVAGGDETQQRDAISAHLRSHGYTHAWFDGLNDYFLADEHAPDLAQHFGTPVNVTDDFTAVSDSDQVVVELVAAKLGLARPASAAEVVMRVEAVLADRIAFESELLELRRTAAEVPGTGAAVAGLQDELATVRDGLAATQEEAASLRAELTAARREVDGLDHTRAALEQTAFERERTIAWYGAQLARLQADRARLEGELARSGGDAEALRQSAAGTQQRLDDILASTSWRSTLPIRAARRPQAYVAKLLRR